VEGELELMGNGEDCSMELLGVLSSSTFVSTNVMRMGKRYIENCNCIYMRLAVLLERF
jgi:hypothetical protein